jgi:hypothetical protein
MPRAGWVARRSGPLRDRCPRRGSQPVLRATGTQVRAAWIDGAQAYMHKYLCSGCAQVNHENGTGLDNRRENLRGVGRAN